jgi:hypothetical protein
LNWGTILSLIIPFVATGISLLEVFSPNKFSKIYKSFASFIKRRLPSLSLPIITGIVLILIATILAAAIPILLNSSLTSSNQPTSSTPSAPSQYTTYSSHTDVPNFATTLRWDASVISQHSMSIELDVQPISNPRDIAQLTKKFCPDYTFFIVAQLDTDSTTFSAEPKDQMQQPIGQGNFSFHWIATPLQPGSQAIDVVIKGIWISQSNGSKQIEYYLGSHTWDISVADNTQLFVLGQFNLSQILGYAASVIVSVAFIQIVITYFGSRKQATTQVAQPSQPPQPPLSNQPNTQQPVP